MLWCRPAIQPKPFGRRCARRRCRSPPDLSSPCGQWAACNLQKLGRYLTFKRSLWIKRVVSEAVLDNKHGIEHPTPLAADLHSAAECDYCTLAKLLQTSIAWSRLATVRIKKAVPENERIGVVQVPVGVFAYPVRFPEIGRMAWLAFLGVEFAGYFRFRFPFAPCAQISRVLFVSLVDPLPMELKKLPFVRIHPTVSKGLVPTDLAITVGLVLVPRVRELNEAASIGHLDFPLADPAQGEIRRAAARQHCSRRIGQVFTTATDGTSVRCIDIHISLFVAQSSPLRSSTGEYPVPSSLRTKPPASSAIRTPGA